MMFSSVVLWTVLPGLKNPWMLCFQGHRQYISHCGSICVLFEFQFPFWRRLSESDHSFPNDALLSPGFNLSVDILSGWCFTGEKWFLLLFAWSWPVRPSDRVFPSSLPRGLRLSQSYSVSEVGVVEVKSYLTTPINLFILNTALGCNWLILQIFSPAWCRQSCLSFLMPFH